MTDTIPYFDGHNDVLLRLLNKAEGDAGLAFINGGQGGQLDLPRAIEGHFVGGLFALYPTSMEKKPSFSGGISDNTPPMLEEAKAWHSVSREYGVLQRILLAGKGQVRLCTSVADITAAMAAGELAIVLHMEGAEAIGPDLEMLYTFYGMGLRSLGPVWSRSTIFAHGVPFTFPHSPDTGDGLTDLGKALIAECNKLKILIDLSHLNEKGFWDIEKLSDSPLVATHSNVHALCPTPRNLTDKQLDAIKQSKGLVGLNFGTGFLREDGKWDADTPLETMVRHVDYLVEKLGEDHVGIGSDFDGAMISKHIEHVGGSQALFNALRAHGYDQALLEKIGYKNWLGVLDRIWS